MQTSGRIYRTRSYYKNKKYLIKQADLKNVKVTIEAKEKEEEEYELETQQTHDSDKIIEISDAYTQTEEDQQTQAVQTDQTYPLRDFTVCPFCEEDVSKCAIFTISNPKPILLRDKHIAKRWVALPRCLRSGCKIDNQFVKDGVEMLATSLFPLPDSLELLTVSISIASQTSHSLYTLPLKQARYKGICHLEPLGCKESLEQQLLHSFSDIYRRAVSEENKPTHRITVYRLCVEY